MLCGWKEQDAEREKGRGTLSRHKWRYSGLRWWSSRVRSSSPPTNIAKMCLHLERYSQNIYCQLAEDLRRWKGKKIFMWLGRRKEKKKGIGMRPVLLGGSCERGNVPIPWEAPHGRGNQLGQKGSFKASEENAAASLWQPEQRERDGQCCCPALPSLICATMGVDSFLGGFN